MLSKQNRLILDKDYKRVYHFGKTIRGDFFKIKILSTHLNASRLGIVIPIKISKKSTNRNKLKRQLRAIFSKLIEYTRGNYDIIINIFKTPKKSYNKMEIEIINLVKKSGILNKYD